ncbi:MAG: hypothetical protein ABIG60_05335 [Patescibacteria group bacterium]
MGVRKRDKVEEEAEMKLSEKFYRASVGVILESVFLGQAKKRRQKVLRKLRRSEKVITTIVDIEELYRGFFERSWNRFHISVHSMIKAVLGAFMVEVAAALQKGPIHFSQETGFSGKGWQALPNNVQKVLFEWYQEYSRALKDYHRLEEKKELHEYESLSIGILGGWLVGGIVGRIFDSFFKFSAVLEGVVRFVAGAGDTIGGALATFWDRFSGKHKKKKNEVFGEKSSVEQFIIGSVLGTFIAPFLHIITILFGVNVSGVGGAFYAVAYSNGDNWTGAFLTMRAKIKKHGFHQGLKIFFSHPFQLANFITVSFILIFNIILRATGVWRPDSFFDYAIEGAIMNNDSSIASLAVWFYAHRIQKGIRKTALSLLRIRRSLVKIVEG